MTTTGVDSRIKVEKADPNVLKEHSILSWPIWTKEVSVFDWRYDDKEVCYFLEGAVTVTTDQGEVSFGVGDIVTFPKGLSCTWNVTQAVKKHYRFGD